jgi:hypothetical protein
MHPRSDARSSFWEGMPLEGGVAHLSCGAHLAHVSFLAFLNKTAVFFVTLLRLVLGMPGMPGFPGEPRFWVASLDWLSPTVSRKVGPESAQIGWSLQAHPPRPWVMPRAWNLQVGERSHEPGNLNEAFRRERVTSTDGRKSRKSHLQSSEALNHGR